MARAGTIPRVAASSDLVIVLGSTPAPSETFLTAHLRLLPGPPRALVGYPPRLDGRRVLSRFEQVYAAISRRLSGQSTSWGLTRAFVTALERAGARAVLAEYGPVGVGVMDACRQLGLPLAVHFHGYDASVHEVFHRHRESYPRLLAQADAVIAVSHPMCRRLEALGAPASRLHRIPYGVDPERFQGGKPGDAPPVLLAVGRLVEKKGLRQTIRAFAMVHKRHPGAQLRVVGGGPLRNECEALAASLGVAASVTFLGEAPQEVVSREMRAARAFVQHSVVAPNGDREGTPVAIIEAGATGLPVVATRHEGIPEVVLDGVTGWLVEEGDVAAMAARMGDLVGQPERAAAMGSAARAWVSAEFRQDRQLSQLAGVLAGMPGPR